jgi:hypothetical protein
MDAGPDVARVIRGSGEADGSLKRPLGAFLPPP